MADLYSFVVKHINFPLGLALKWQRKFYKHYQEIERVQWLDFSSIERVQFSRLKILLSYAFQHSAYWRLVFEALKLTPDDIVSLRDFQKLPVLSKSALQTHLDDIITCHKSAPGIIANASGGSTGEPTIFYQNIERNYRRDMDQIRDQMIFSLKKK